MAEAELRSACGPVKAASGLPPRLETGAWRAVRPLELAVLVCVLTVAATLRLELLTVRSLWHDEAFSLAVARKPAAYILKHLSAADPHPPGYYLLLRATLLVFGDGLAAARGLSAVLGLAAVLLTWWTARRLFDAATAVAAAALVALNPFQVFASNEVRMYPLVTCLAVLSTLAAWVAWDRGDGRAWVGYGLTLAAMAYTSYYTVLVALPQWAWLVLARRGPRLVLSLAVAAVLYAPWIGTVPWAGPAPASLREPFRWSYVLELFSTQAYGGYLARTTTYLAGGGFHPSQHGMLLAPFVLLGLAGFAALRSQGRKAAGLVALVWVGGLAGWAAASAALGHLAAYPRHLVFLQPFLAMLVGAGVVHLGDVARRVPRVTAGAAAALLVLSFLWPAVNNLQGDPEYQSFRYDRAARLVRALYRPGDALIFYQGGAQRVFREYFDPGGLQIAVDPQLDRWTREGMRPLLRSAVEPVKQVQGRVWLVLAWPYPPDSPLDLIEAVERFGFRRAVRQSFGGLEVVGLVRADRP